MSFCCTCFVKLPFVLYSYLASERRLYYPAEFDAVTASVTHLFDNIFLSMFPFLSLSALLSQ